MEINEAVTAERQERDARPLSPCILVCTLDDNNVCLGCGRSLEQISSWAVMSKEEQWAVIDQLSRRENEN